MPAGSFPRRLWVLWTLYFVQGLPFGFQATALPLYLRDAGVSLTNIGLATALSLPWSLKFLWAPWIDGYAGGRFGRRRSWILPLQFLLGASCLATAFVPVQTGLRYLLLSVLLMNLFAATLDIAVDGLAIDVLPVSELGYGNVAQVVGYKIGMLTGGGLLVWASAATGWNGLFLGMAALVGLCFLVALAWDEKAALRDKPDLAARGPRGITEILSALLQSFARPGAGWLLLFIATYKLGESMADTMFKPFLIDAGFGREQIGLWVGTWGMLFSIAGSVAGGYLARRLPLLHAVGIAALFRALSVGGEWWLSLVQPTAERVLIVTCAEHFFGGALTTALFAYMMSRVDRRIGATHYTLLAAIEVWGKLPSAWVSGWITDHSSYSLLFALSVVLSLAFLGLLAPLSRASTPAPSE